MNKIILIMATIFFVGCTTSADTDAKGRLHEADYQKAWCAEMDGQAEVTLPDGTRCDCITDTHSVEVDFAKEFYQGIGQALYYSMQTGKRAGIVLILEDAGDRRYWLRLNTTIRHFELPIDTWAVGEGAY